MKKPERNADGRFEITINGVWRLAGRPLACLKLTKYGHPQHPLYVKGNARPVSFR